jgi:orotidine-5'-phosphate decarboxylase
MGSVLIVALDLDPAAALDVVGDLESGNCTVAWKIGLPMLCSGHILPWMLCRQGKEVIIDLKLRDIPRTVEKAAKAAIEIGAAYVTAHADMPGVLEAAVQGAGGRVLAVTVMTSEGLSAPDLRDRMVMCRTENAAEAGCAGVICPPAHVRAAKRCAPHLPVLCPGVRPSWFADRGGHVAAMTPYEAIVAGADRLIIGEPIVAQNIAASLTPRRAALQIADEIVEALEKRK